MLIGEMTAYEQTLKKVISGLLPGYINQGISAHLMALNFTPDVANDTALSDVSTAEITGPDYSPKPLTGLSVIAASGAVSIASDSILFGDPISLPSFRYLLFATGLPGASESSKQLVAYCDLAPSGGGVREVVRGSLVFNQGTSGWLSFSQP